MVMSTAAIISQMSLNTISQKILLSILPLKQHPQGIFVTMYTCKHMCNSCIYYGHATSHLHCVMSCQGAIFTPAQLFIWIALVLKSVTCARIETRVVGSSRVVKFQLKSVYERNVFEINLDRLRGESLPFIYT